MKRGKDDEKVTGPLFPRFHVNDTEKGGPRAPPRNKMALYEQLSIPSQRFTPGALPLKSSATTNSVSSVSSTQRSGLERNLPFKHHVTPPISNQLSEQFQSCQPDGRNMNASVEQVEKRKKVGDEDDFRVPVFVHSGMGRHQNKTKNSLDRENLTLFRASYSGTSKIQTDNNAKVVIFPGLSSRHDVINQKEENVEVCTSSRDQSVRSLSVRGKIAQTEEEVDAYSNQDCDGNSVADFSRLHEHDDCLLQEPTTELQLDDDFRDDSLPDPELTGEREKENALQRSDSCSREVHSRSNGSEIGNTFHGDETSGFGHCDNSNDLSEISMLDSVSAVAISPDDVVGIIGQKHFWKARRAIVNQQRVFAVQVFELHRLIKVQQLIAGSPHLLLEDSTYLGNSSVKDSPPKKLLSEYAADTPTHVAKRKHDSEKSNHKVECSAENAIGRTSSSLKNASQPADCGPYLGNPTSVHVNVNPNMTPWYFPQSFGQQWLVPVMSPSEGLVYKPYTAPGFMGSGCGGCGPFSSTPLSGNFMNPANGVPASQHHGGPPVGHGYYPPYSVPVMHSAGLEMEQMNGFALSGLKNQIGQSGGGANFNTQNQSSCNLPSQKNGATPQVMKLNVTKDAEVQGSTASSPGDRSDTRIVQDPNGRDAIRLCPLVPATPEGEPQLQDSDQPARVIKAVPRNPRSATESAARIFQSIQQERKHLDSN